MTDFEALVKSIMKEAKADGEPVTREEAEEMARMEIGAKEIKRYETSDEPKKERKLKERKVDEEKKNLLALMSGLLEGIGATEMVTKTETEISFALNGNAYSLKLTKHRPPKK